MEFPRPLLLTRYFTKSLVLAILFTAAVLIGLVCLLDFMQRSDDFLRIKPRSGLPFFLIQYYGYRLPRFFVQLGPILITAGSMMALVGWARQREFIPVWMSGISSYRLLAPVFVIGALAAAGTFVAQEFILPWCSEGILKTDIRLKGQQSISMRLVCDGMGQRIFMQEYLPAVQLMSGVLVTGVDEQGNLRMHVKADAGHWVSDEEREEWILTGVTLLEFTPDGLRAGPPKEYDEYSLETDLTPAGLIAAKNPLMYGTIRDLKAIVARRPSDAAARVQLHARMAYPLMNLILPALGIPLVLRRETRNYLIGVAAALLLGLVFYAVNLALSDLAERDELHPAWLAAWLPPVLFGGVAVIFADDVMT